MHGQKGKPCWVSVCLRNHKFEDPEGQIAICDALERVHWSIQLEQRSHSPKQRRVMTKTLHYSHTAAGWLNHVGWWRQMKQTIQAQTSNHFGEQATDGTIIYCLVWENIFLQILYVRHQSQRLQNIQGCIWNGLVITEINLRYGTSKLNWIHSKLLVILALREHSRCNLLL